MSRPKKVSPVKLPLKKIAPIILLIVIFLVLLISVKALSTLSGGSMISTPGFRGESTVSSKGIMMDLSSSPSMAADSVITSPEMGSTLPRQKIINGSLSLFVDNVESTIDNIKTIADTSNGFTSQSSIYESDNHTIVGSITVRIPVDQFDVTVMEIKELAVKIERESTGSDDVTDQVFDTDTRIKNLEALETQYRDILKKATKIEDILQVTNQLNIVRQQIESLETQLKYLSQSTDMATISVDLKAVADVQVFGLTWKPLIIVKQALRDMVAGIINYLETIIRVILYLPVLIIWLTTFGLIILGLYKASLLIYKKIRK
ncbi:MAG: DUF4349 domain-containing protein [Candidatus Vogelbacteria bacterium]|jgi:hypothetical protein|nr:DUF4349 domain-containing protein [Candidatus Vogelbacteria bacterium]